MQYIARALMGKAVPAELEPLVATLAANAADFDSAVAAEVTDEWWSLPDTCDVFGAQIDVASIITNPVSGPYEGSPRAFSTFLEDADRSLYCQWFTQDLAEPFGMFNVTIVPGGASGWEEYTALAETDPYNLGPVSTEPVDVAGAQEALVYSYGGFEQKLVATDGVNVISVGGSLDSDLRVQAAERAIAELAAG